MEKKVQVVKSRRTFSDDFKRQVVKEFEEGFLSAPQLSRLYGVCDQQVYDWIYKFSIFNQKGNRIVEKKDSHTIRFREMEARIAELERSVGQKQVRIDYLEKMISLADAQLGTDIKKNSDTPPSAGSGRTSGR